MNACDAAFSPVPAPIGEHDVRRWLERAVAMIAVVGPNGEIVACGGGMLRGDVLVVDS